MTQPLARAAAVALLSALLGVASLGALYAATASLHVEFSTDPPTRLMRGVYPAERLDEGRLTFAWTGQEVLLRLPGIDRSVPWVMQVRLRGARVNPQENPEVTFLADGLFLSAHRSTTEFQDVEVTIPPRPERRRDTAILMRSSTTFVPGPADPRALGVMLDRLSLTPQGVVVAPRSAFLAVAVTGALFGAALVLLGVTTGPAVGGATLVAIGAAALLARGFAPFTDYAAIVMRLAWMAPLPVVIAAAIERVKGQQGQRLRNTARFVLVFSTAALFLKVAVLLHPDMPVGDALFHAHRFQAVLRGSLYFTSVAPGNYTFPYAPGLYVFAIPFADLVRRGDADMMLLRVIVMTVDVAAGALLYLMVVRAWGERTTAAIAVAVYQLVPLEFRVVTIANLTNAFGQSLAVCALALMTAPWVRWERRWTVALLTLVISAAFLSHTSTFAILSGAGVLIAATFLLRGGPALRSPAGAVFASVLAAIVISVVLYYGHFGETYRAELTRLGSETATAAPDAGGRGISARLGMVPYYLHVSLGVPALILALAGGWRLWQRSGRDRLTLAIAGWLAGCAVFLVLGILTPADFRYYLASIPAVAIAAAAGAAGLWSSGGYRRLAAAALLGWVVAIGVETWWSTLHQW